MASKKSAKTTTTDETPAPSPDAGPGAVVQAPDAEVTDPTPAQRNAEPAHAFGHADPPPVSRQEAPEINVRKGRPENEQYEVTSGNVEDPYAEDFRTNPESMRKRGKPEEEIADAEFRSGVAAADTAPAYTPGDPIDAEYGRGASGEPAGSSPPNVEQGDKRLVVTERQTDGPGPLTQAVLDLNQKVLEAQANARALVADTGQPKTKDK